jgi:hypothetical protein
MKKNRHNLKNCAKKRGPGSLDPVGGFAFPGSFDFSMSRGKFDAERVTKEQLVSTYRQITSAGSIEQQRENRYFPWSIGWFVEEKRDDELERIHRAMLKVTELHVESARSYTAKAIETPVNIMRAGRPSEGLAAATALLDRSWSKPVQPTFNDRVTEPADANDMRDAIAWVHNQRDRLAAVRDMRELTDAGPAAIAATALLPEAGSNTGALH